MKIKETKIKDVFILNPEVYFDNRGFFMESYNASYLKDITFVQDNHSYSQYKGTLRGIHLQISPMAQTKLVRCTRGEILDVAIDLRKESKTYLQFVSVKLTDKNFQQLLIPKRFGHAFLTLTDDVEVHYKVDAFYSKEHERSIHYLDPKINIPWPDIEVFTSKKDREAPFLNDVDLGGIK